MRISHRPSNAEIETRDRILKAALRLFAKRGFEATTTRDLAEAAGVAEGTLFRHFPTKKAILIEVATQGWVDLLTDLLTALSEMGSYRAIAQVMRKRVLHLHENADIMRVCFMEAQFHPDLRERIQREVIDKMTDVTEAFFETAMEQGVYRQMSPKTVARVFLGMFAVAGFSQDTILSPNASPGEMQAMAEEMADIFLNGVLIHQKT